MEPTAAQLAARLNPTATNVNLPTEGQVFTSNVNYYPTAYTIKNGKIVTLTQQQNIAQTSVRGSDGQTYNVGSIVPQGVSVHPIDPGYNGYLTSSQYVTPGYNNDQISALPNFGIGDVQDYIDRHGSLPASGTATINSTPNALATPDQLAAAKSATGQQLAADQGKNVTSTTDATGNTISTTAAPLANVPQTATVAPATSGSTVVANPPTSIQVQPTATSAQAPTSALQPGMTGDAVKQLQDYLVSKGYLTQAQVSTGYGTYGPQTTAAVAALQKDLGVNNSSGVGYFGPMTLSALQQNPTVTASNGSGTGASGTTATDTTAASGTGLTYDSNYGVSTDQWNQMNDAQRAIIAAAYTAKQTAYNTSGQQMTFADALTQAAQDPNIVAKYADAAKLDTQAFQQSLQQLQQSGTTEAQNNQIAFETARKQLADQSAAAGQANSGFRTKAQENLGTQEQGIVQSSRSTMQQNLNDLTRNFEGKYGTAATTPATAGFTDPYAVSNISLSGQYNPNANGANTLAGTLAGGVTGSQPVAKQGDINTKATSIYNTVNTTPTIA